MTLFNENFVYNVFGVFFALLATLVAFVAWKLSFWKRHGFPVSSTNGIIDLLLQRESYGQFVAKLYTEAKSKNLKHIATYFFIRATYVPTDPEIIKYILTKDFGNFMDRGMYFNERDDPLSCHLFNIEGEKWKILRQKVTPTFTSGQMKIMFQTLADCGEQLREYLKKGVYTEEAVDIKDILARLTTDIIGSCAFGLTCNTLENPDAEFRKYGRLFFESKFSEIARFIISFALPRELLRLLRFKSIRRDMHEFFSKAVKDTVTHREKNNIYRKDFMQLLLQLKNKGTLESENDAYINGNVKKLTMNEIAAQAFIFYLAGFETSSTAMTFAIYEMALNQTIQDKAREEINAVLAKHNGKLTYEGIMEMSYLQKVLDESLRKYPPVPFLDRHCKSDFKIPGTDMVLPKNTHVNIAVAGLHHDPEYYPDPEKFDPERFSEENKNSRPQYTYLPFGDGPRVCIGLRFGVAQAKVGISSLLRDYRIKLHPKTDVPLVIDPKCIITSTKGGVYVTMEKITKDIPAA